MSILICCTLQDEKQGDISVCEYSFLSEVDSLEME